MRRLATVLAVPLLAACGGGSEPSADSSAPSTPSSAAAPSDDPTFPGGNALSSYEGSPTYPWRATIIEQQDALLAAIQEQQPNADEGEFRDVLDTCLDLSQRKTDEEVTRKRSGAVPRRAARANDRRDLDRRHRGVRHGRVPLPHALTLPEPTWSLSPATERDWADAELVEGAVALMMATPGDRGVLVTYAAGRMLSAELSWDVPAGAVFHRPA